MATMVAEPNVNHVPTMMGGVGAEALKYFYANHFIGHCPDAPRPSRSAAPWLPYRLLALLRWMQTDQAARR
jgi:hypothetical protein